MEEQKRNPAQGLSESEQVQVRRQKLADLQAAGNDPFTLTKFPQDAYSADLKEEFKELPNETDSGKQVALAGRMMSKRVMGKASFAHLRDDKGDIQLYVRRDELGEEAYAAFKKLDVGDIIGVKGEVFRTKTGELSVRATELTLLAKSLRPLPEKFHGLTDTEMRYRQRYVDLIANPEVKDTFVKRSQILKEIRAYLDEKGFLEVDTPILTPFEIGASARPFYTHHNSLNMDMVLRIETELYLKRLIVGGMDRVYEVGRIFRNEGMDPKHNPEFTSIELYQAFTDFHGMMDLVEELYKRLALKICGSMVIPYQGKQIDMGHWERLTMVEAVKKYSGVDFNDWKSDEDAIASAKEHHVELPEVPTKGAILAEFFDAFVEDKLIQPTFIYDYPVEISPLAKRKPDDPAFTERFEYFIDCTEYGNAFSELNDPIDQKGRFERQVAERKAIEPDCKAQVDYDYVNALEYGLPPTGGLGFGIPASGTMAHSWVQMFPTEYDAFKKYAEMYPDNCVLLVDTYNVLRHGVPDAIKVFDEVLKPMGKRPKGVRIDSGDIAYLSKKARQMLDAAGYPDCTVCASNSLDEYIVRDLILQGARVDSFGIGENMITAKSDPVFGGVYKLAAVKEDDGSYTPKMKLSESVEKMTIPCLKKVWRIYDEDGKAQADLITMADEVVDTKNGITLFDPIETWKECTYVNSTARCISTPIYENGKRVYTNPNLADIRKFCKAQVGTLWDEVKRFENPHRYYVDLSRNLWDTRSELLKKLSK